MLSLCYSVFACSFLLKRALNQTKWKEYFSGGRKYYYNVCHCISQDVPCLILSLQTDTKESKWDMPDELLLVLEKVEKEPQAGYV